MGSEVVQRSGSRVNTLQKISSIHHRPQNLIRRWADVQGVGGMLAVRRFIAEEFSVVYKLVFALPSLQFCQLIHETLTALVQSAEESDERRRTECARCFAPAISANVGFCRATKDVLPSSFPAKIVWSSEFPFC